MFNFYNIIYLFAFVLCILYKNTKHTLVDSCLLNFLPVTYSPGRTVGRVPLEFRLGTVVQKSHPTFLTHNNAVAGFTKQAKV